MSKKEKENVNSGMKFNRYYTVEGINVFDMFEYDIQNIGIIKAYPTW